jgi:hypothetical protein
MNEFKKDTNPHEWISSKDLISSQRSGLMHLRIVFRIENQSMSFDNLQEWLKITISAILQRLETISENRVCDENEDKSKLCISFPISAPIFPERFTQKFGIFVDPIQPY